MLVCHIYVYVNQMCFYKKVNVSILAIICFELAFLLHFVPIARQKNINTIIVTISLPKVGPGSFQNFAVMISVNSPDSKLVLLLSILDVLAIGNGQLHLCNINK